MTPSDRMEIAALREEQARLRRTLDLLDRRLAAFDLRTAAPPPAPKPAPAPAAAAAVGEADSFPYSAPLALAPSPIPPVAKPAPPPLPPIPPSAEVPAESFELKLGTYWLARIGIVILLTGFVFLGNYAYHHIVPHLGAWGKLSLLALAGAALGGAGAWSAPRSATVRPESRDRASCSSAGWAAHRSVRYR